MRCFLTLLFALSGFGFLGSHCFQLLGCFGVGLAFSFSSARVSFFFFSSLHTLTLSFKHLFTLDALFFL
jgi:hypothetical protein